MVLCKILWLSKTVRLHEQFLIRHLGFVNLLPFVVLALHRRGLDGNIWIASHICCPLHVIVVLKNNDVRSLTKARLAALVLAFATPVTDLVFEHADFLLRFIVRHLHFHFDNGLLRL